MESELTGQADFDPNDPEQMSKMIDLMRKNGDWDETDEAFAQNGQDEYGDEIPSNEDQINFQK